MDHPFRGQGGFFLLLLAHYAGFFLSLVAGPAGTAVAGFLLLAAIVLVAPRVRVLAAASDRKSVV